MPASSDVKQLLLQVDASIAVAQRNVNLLANSVEKDAARMNVALGGTEEAHRRVGNSFNQMRIAQLELTHVVTASADAYAAGSSPLRILSLEMGRVAEAAMFLGGTGGRGVMAKLAQFMGGPWGLAVLLGANVLAQFIPKLFSAGDGVDELVKKLQEHHDKTVASAHANEEFEHTFDGIMDKMKKETDAIEEQNRSLEENVRLKQQSLAQDTANSHQVQGENLKKIAFDQEMIYNLTNEAASPTADVTYIEEINKKIAQYKEEIKTLQNENKQLDVQIRENARASLLAAADLYQKNAQALVDPISAVNKKFDDQIQHLKDLGKYTQDAANHIEILRKKEIDAARAAERASKSTGEFGKQVGFAGAEAIANAAGLHVNSGPRSFATQQWLYDHKRTPSNPVALPGHSAHEGVNGKWALDIAFAPGLTPQKLRKIYGDQGVKLTAVYKESGHYHIEGKRPGYEVAADRDAIKAQHQSIRQDDAFSKEDAKLDKEYIDARTEMNKSIIGRAVAEREALYAQYDEYKATLDAAVAEGRLKPEQEKLLLEKKQAVIQQKDANLTQQEALDLFDQQKEQENLILQGQVDHLQAVAGLTDNLSQRKKINDDIIDLLLQIKINAAQEAIHAADINHDTAARARAEAQLAQAYLGAQDAHAQNARENESPLQRYIRESTADVSADWQNAEVNGLEKLNSDLDDAITGAKSLKAAFKDLVSSILHDLVDIAIKEEVIVPLAKALFGGTSGGSGGGIGGILGSVLGAVVGGGNGIEIGGGTSAFFNAHPFGGAMADGGMVTAGKAYLVGEEHPEFFVPRTNGTIIPSMPKAILPSARGSGRDELEVTIGFGDAPAFAPFVQQVSSAHAAQAIKVSVKHTNDIISTIRRTKLMGQ